MVGTLRERTNKFSASTSRKAVMGACHTGLGHFRLRLGFKLQGAAFRLFLCLSHCDWGSRAGFTTNSPAFSPGTFSHYVQREAIEGWC